MIDFLQVTAQNSNPGGWYALATGGGITTGWLCKYLIDKLVEKRNGNNNSGMKVTLAKLETNQMHCMKNQEDTLNELREIKEYSRDQATYLKIIAGDKV